MADMRSPAGPAESEFRHLGESPPGGSISADRRVTRDVEGLAQLRTLLRTIARRWDPALLVRIVGLVAVVCLAARVPGLRLPIGLALVAVVAYANGANDISKAIATLVGSGAADYHRATIWGTAAGAIGASVSVLTGAALLAAFSTKLLPAGAVIGLPFALGAVVGTAGWVLLASHVGLPVSTTHALTGSIVAVGAASYGVDGVQWVVLGSVVVLPLLVSPLVGIVLSLVLIVVARAVRLRGIAALRPVHWLASGMTAFARGLNDAPKIAALGSILMLATGAADHFGAGSVGVAAIVALAMAVGSYVGGHRVTATLATKVTRMDDVEGTTANIVTALLVTAAATNGLPVSTTHVSGGSIIGIGVSTHDGRLDRSVVRGILLTWLITLPGAGLIAVGVLALASISLGP